MEGRDRKGRFGPGNPGKVKGTKNKSITRTRIAGLIETNWDRFEKELNGLEGKAYVEYFIKLMPYHVPTFSAVNFSLKNMSEEDLKFLIQTLKASNDEQSEDDF